MNSFNFILVDTITENRINKEIIINDIEYFNKKLDKLKNRLFTASSHIYSNIQQSIHFYQNLITSLLLEKDSLLTSPVNS